MNRILSFPDGPNRSDPNQSGRSPLALVECSSWCLHQSGHPDVVHEAEQVCAGYPHRIEASQGGGSSEDHGINTPGSLVMQVERQQGQQPTIVVGVQLLDREFYVRFTVPEFVNTLAYGSVALSQAQTA